MSDTERVTIRIPTERLNALQALVDAGEYKSISDAIRVAIEKFVDEQLTPDYIKRMTIELPKGNVINLENLVKLGDSVSVEDAVRNAVREYVRRRLDRAMQENG